MKRFLKSKASLWVPKTRVWFPLTQVKSSVSLGMVWSSGVRYPEALGADLYGAVAHAAGAADLDGREDDRRGARVLDRLIADAGFIEVACAEDAVQLCDGRVRGVRDRIDVRRKKKRELLRL